MSALDTPCDLPGPPAAWARWQAAGKPRVVALLSTWDCENNAVRQLATGLRARGFRVLEVYFLDWRNNTLVPASERHYRALADILHGERAAVLGVSLRGSPYRDATAALCAAVRRRVDIPIVVGGTHASVRPADTLSFAHAAFRGEADDSLPWFLDAFFAGRTEALLGTPGAWIRDEAGGVRRNAPTPPNADLDALPWRDYGHPDKWWIHEHGVSHADPRGRDVRFTIMASLGCPRRCRFCLHSHELAPGYNDVRARSVSSVIAEVDAYRARFPGVRRVRFDDAIFGLRPAWLAEFAERWPAEVGLPFELMTEPHRVDAAYAHALRRAGADIVEMGIQSCDDVNREVLGRPSSTTETERAVRHLTAARLILRCLVMVDVPGTTDEDRKALFQLVQSIPLPYDMFLFSLTLFPGTAMVEEGLADGSITPAEVEAHARKSFAQYRVDLAWPRPPEEARWLALMILDASGLVPRRALTRIAERGLWRDDPQPLIQLARTAGLAKLARIGAGMAWRGEFPGYLLRRWVVAHSWVTI